MDRRTLIAGLVAAALPSSSVAAAGSSKRAARVLADLGALHSRLWKDCHRWDELVAIRDAIDVIGELLARTDSGPCGRDQHREGK